jgi:hypothetical protein
MTASERLDRYAAFARSYSAKAAPPIDDLDAESPTDPGPIVTCSGCQYPCMQALATEDVNAGTFYCPRCIKAGGLKGAA